MPDVDPWLPARLAAQERYAAAEKQIRAAVLAAMTEYLATARAMVLGEVLTASADLVTDLLVTGPDDWPFSITRNGHGEPISVLFAAAGDQQPPNLDGWPNDSVWASILKRVVLPVVQALFGEAFAAAARTAVVSMLPYQDAFLERVVDRLQLWPSGVFEEIRLELQESQTQNEAIPQQRDRIGRVLNIDARSRELQAAINDIERELEAEDLDPGRRKVLRSQRADLYGQKDDEDLRWHWQAERIARTEVTATLNGGDFDGKQTWQQDSGEELWHLWLCTTDERVRDTHWRAYGQVVRVGEPFEVGNAHLLYPCEPGGPAEEVIQCRCNAIDVPAEDVERLTAEYETRLAELDAQDEDDAASLQAAAPTEGDTAVTTLAVEPDETDAAEGTEEETQTGLPVGAVGILAPMGKRTGDGRMLAVTNPVRTRPLPLVFLSQEELTPGHDGARISGRIEAVWTDAADNILGLVRWDLGCEEGQESARQLKEGFARWVSVDPDEVQVEWVWFKGDTEVDPPSQEDIELHWLIEWGEIVDVDDPLEGLEEVMVMTDYRLIGATFVSQPAFAEAEIAPVWTEEDMDKILADQGALVASGAAVVSVEVADPEPLSLVAGGAQSAPPAAYFAETPLPGPTAVTIDEDGRIYGHLALWETCHTGIGDRCQQPPRSAAGYAYYHVGEVITAEGESVAVGKITLGGGHADPRLGHIPALAHYDDSGAAVAAVRAYEDEHGIAIAGAILSCVTDDQLAALRRSPLSGDWRRVGSYGLELVAALCVNVPGFPVPRTIAASAAGQPVSLVAAGFNPRASVRNRTLRRQPGVDTAALAVAVADELEGRAQRRTKVATVLARVGADPASRVARAVERVLPASEQ